MIDYFAIGLTHCLLALAALRLLTRADLDDDNAGATEKTLDKPWRRLKAARQTPADPEPEDGRDA